MTIRFFHILFNPNTQCQNWKPQTIKFTAIDTPYIRKVGWNNDKNNIAASESRGYLTCNFLKCQVCFSTNEVICLLIEPSVEGTRLMCILTFIATCIITYFCSKTNQMHQCLEFILFWCNSTCFGRSFRPSSGVHGCTYNNRHMSNRYCSLPASGNGM